MTDEPIQKQTEEIAGFSEFDEIGATGVRINFGEIYQNDLPQLRGRKGIRTYAEMSQYEPVIATILFAVEMVIRQVDWSVKPGGDEPGDEEAANFVEECRNDMSQSWEDFLSDVLTFLPFGFSWHEIVYKTRGGMDTDDPQKRSKFDDGRVGWRKLPIRSQESLWAWIYDDDDGNVIAMQQNTETQKGIVNIPIQKSLVFKTKNNKGIPEGQSVLDRSFRPYFYKKGIQEYEAIGIERELAGLPVIEIPPSLLNPNASAADKAALEEFKKIGRRVKRNQQGAVLMPLAYDADGNKKYNFSLLTSGGKRQIDTDKVIERYNFEMATTLLADFILLGHSQSGTQALSVDKTAMFGRAVSAWLDSIANIFNSFGIPRLMKLNTFNFTNMPVLTHGEVSGIDPLQTVEAILKLSQAGAVLFPDENLTDALVTVIDPTLPKPEADAGT